MTEADWHEHAVPGLMLRLVGGASERKLRLFVCNCAELAWRSILRREVPPALTPAWNLADEPIRAVGSASRHPTARGPTTTYGTESAEMYAVRVLEAAARPQDAGTVRNVRTQVEALAVQLATDNRQSTPDASQAARTAMAALLRDIFGNPFRPVIFSPEWRTDTAVALARQMYDAREFSAMPILADALQDAGCDNDDVLAHCRDASFLLGEPPAGSPKPPPVAHVRGCWVVDLVLGKE